MAILLRFYEYKHGDSGVSLCFYRNGSFATHVRARYAWTSPEWRVVRQSCQLRRWPLLFQHSSKVLQETSLSFDQKYTILMFGCNLLLQNAS